MPTQAMGFCIFNNIAIAAKYAVEVRGLERVMIFDWDVHHANSTNEVFHASNNVLFVSIHQSPLFPGTGPADDVGEGDGRGLHGESAGPRQDRAMTCGSRSSSMSLCRSRSRSSRSSCSSRPATTRTSRTRWPTAT